MKRTYFTKQAWFFAFTLLLHALIWRLAFLFPAESGPLVLHYQIGSTIDFLGDRSTLLTIPIVGAVILLFNTGLSFLLWHRDHILLWLLLGTACLFQLLLLVALAALLSVNNI